MMRHILNVMTNVREQFRPSRSWIVVVLLTISAIPLREFLWGQIALALVSVGFMLLAYGQFIRGLTIYLQNNLIQAFLLAVFFLITWGMLFTELGVPDLIWHEKPVFRFCTAVAATLVLALLGINAYYLGPLAGLNVDKVLTFYRERVLLKRVAEWLAPRQGDPPQLAPLFQFLWVVQLPFLTLLVVPAFLPLMFPYVPPLRPAVSLGSYLCGLSVWAGGVLTGVLVTKLALSLGELMSPYSNPFADAVGTASRNALGLATGFVRWLRGIAERAWDLVAALWGHLARGEPSKTIGPPMEALWSWIVELGDTSDPIGVGAANQPHQPADLIGPEPDEPAKLLTPEAKGRSEEIKALFSLVVVVTLFFVALNLVDAFDMWEVTPGTALYSLLALLVITAALAKILFPPERWYWRFPMVVGIVLWIAWANRSVDKLQYDNMAYDGLAKTGLTERVRELYFTPSDSTSWSGSDRGLVGDLEAREAWLRRMSKSRTETSDPAKGNKPKPKLVVISCSGGGARSLVWTSCVLDRLGSDIAGFDDSVRAISAGSAGAVGAGYYVKARYDRLPMSRTPPANRLTARNWSVHVPPDSQSGVVRSIALYEIWRMFNAVPVGNAPPEDRGRVLEESWKQLRQLPLEELREAERAGLIPSLILEPVTLEDGRRLFISNLDVGRGFPANSPSGGRGLVLTGGGELLFSKGLWNASRSAPELVRMIREIESGLDLYTKASKSRTENSAIPTPGERQFDVTETNYSLTGVEFSGLFTRVNGFRLATAARMSAAFPMFTPAVYLPCEPPLRVVDSGFFDNFGVDAAAAWLFANRDWLKCHTSGVLLVQVRAMGRREDRTGARSGGARPAAGIAAGYQLIGSVLEGASRAFSTTAIFRNDREVAWLSELFNGPENAKQRDQFFTTAVFENTAIVRFRPKDPAKIKDVSNWRASFGALTWALTRADVRSIRDALPEKRPEGSDGRQAALKIAELEAELEAATTESERAALTWLIERAENYERLDWLRAWWADDHRPYQAPRPAGATPGATQ